MSVYWDSQKKRWRIEITREGQRIRRLAPANSTKAEAQQWEAKVLRELWLGELGKKPEYTLEEAFTKWAKEELPKLKSETDTRNHAWQLRPYLGKYKLNQAHEVAQLYEVSNPKLSPGTLYQRLSVLRHVCNLAYRKWHWVDTPVADRIVMPSIKNERHVYLTRDQVLSLLIAADKQHTEDAIMIAVYTGMRLGEIVGVEPPNNGMFHLTNTKTSNPRAIPVHPILEDVITRLPLPVGKEAIQHCFTKAKQSVGLDHVHFHDLRHTTASWLVQAGVPLYTAGTLLGHKSVKTTQRYAHLSIRELESAISNL